jgi:hypothetical protein
VLLSDSNETIGNLFLSCTFAKVVSQLVFFTYDIPPPTNYNNMFGNHLNGIDRKTKARICIGVSPLCWSIWR